MVISAADDKVEKIQKINQIFLTEFLEYCVYELDHAYAQKAQDEFDDIQRKLKRH